MLELRSRAGNLKLDDNFKILAELNSINNKIYYARFKRHYGPMRSDPKTARARDIRTTRMRSGTALASDGSG